MAEERRIIEFEIVTTGAQERAAQLEQQLRGSRRDSGRDGQSVGAGPTNQDIRLGKLLGLSGPANRSELEDVDIAATIRLRRKEEEAKKKKSKKQKRIDLRNALAIGGAVVGVAQVFERQASTISNVIEQIATPGTAANRLFIDAMPDAIEKILTGEGGDKVLSALSDSIQSRIDEVVGPIRDAVAALSAAPTAVSQTADAVRGRALIGRQTGLGQAAEFGFSVFESTRQRNRLSSEMSRIIDAKANKAMVDSVIGAVEDAFSGLGQ